MPSETKYFMVMLCAVPPHEWADLDETFECNGRQQSPVDIQTLSVNCGDDEAATVLRWENEPGQKIRWNIKNTGRMSKLAILQISFQFFCNFLTRSSPCKYSIFRHSSLKELHMQSLKDRIDIKERDCCKFKND